VLHVSALVAVCMHYNALQGSITATAAYTGATDVA
jgi:hypothetical protein